MSEDAGYRLGGAAKISAVMPATGAPDSYPFRTPSSLLRDGANDTALGEISVFGGEAREDGREVLSLGTQLTRGRTTTGISLTYHEADPVTRGEVFVDYALTGAFSVGVSGIMSNDGPTMDAPVTRLGVSAAYTLESGSFVQGAIGDGPDTGPVVGLSVGLRF